MGTMTDPAGRLAAVTPSDSTVLSGVRALWIGGAGNVAIRAGGMTAAVTLVGATAGQIIPIRANVVMSTNTTATNIVAMY